ncbi:MAG: hypothetical protein JWL64_2271 [Frankiales bacterium]|nr:hypothetical protein [Frankiales bacterium]
MNTAEAPTAVVVAVVAAGLALGVWLDWRAGAVVMSAGVLLAGGLRVVLPVRRAGWLAVRSRGLDAAVLLTLGGGLLVLALSIPEAR